MSLSAKDYKAISWYAESNQLKVQLSAPPLMYFTRRDTGEEIRVDLQEILLLYHEWNEEDKKARAKQKRIEATRKVIRRAVI
jgi:hypothetical protein